MGIRPFSYGTFGNIPSPPEPPEPPECDGEFYEDKCMYCSEHDNCKQDSENYPLGKNDWQE